jgi:hypothetical protein
MRDEDAFTVVWWASCSTATTSSTIWLATALLGAHPGGVMLTHTLRIAVSAAVEYVASFPSSAE